MRRKRTMKQWWVDFKLDAKLKATQFGEWCGRHKEALIVMVPVFVSGTVELIKVVARCKNTGEEKRLKENYIYDRSAGHYYELKRQPTASEWRLIDHRKSEGEVLGDILDDMKILK